MKIIALLALTLAVTLVNAQPLEKRDFRDTLHSAFRNVTEAGFDTVSDLFDLASKGWKNLRDRIKHHDVTKHFAAIRQRVRARYGSLVDMVSERKFEHVVKATKDVISNAADVLQVKTVVEKVRSLLGREVEDLSDDELAEIVKAVEDDVEESESEDENGVQKRGILRHFHGVLRNATQAGRSAVSDLFDLASRGWKNLRQKIRTYDATKHFAAIRQRVRARYGSLVDMVSEWKFEHVVKATKDVISNAADVLQVKTVVEKVRSLLGREVEDLPDDELAEIVKAVEDDVEESDNDVRKRDLLDILDGVLRNVTDAGNDALSDIIDLASRGWDKLQEEIRDYDITSRFNTIRQRVNSRYGDFIDQLSEVKFEHVVKAAKDVISDAANVLEVDGVVERIRSILGPEVDDLPDHEIADIVKVVEEDVI